MVFLNDLFQGFDSLCEDFHVYKVETVGDCYVASVGVVTGEVINSDFLMQSGESLASPLSVDSEGGRPSLVESDASPRSSQASARSLQALKREGSSGVFHEFAPEYLASIRNTELLVGFAKAMVREARTMVKPKLKTPVELRIGIHTGNVMSGLIGKNPQPPFPLSLSLSHIRSKK